MFHRYGETALSSETKDKKENKAMTTYSNDEEQIHKVLHIHHEHVRQKYVPVMTVLVGSQNYGLATARSDYDTFTFVMPSIADIATLATPVSTTHEDEYGHIDIKDIRWALNLLRKTSPNSVECFAGQYHIIDPAFTPYLASISPITLRCNTHHMMAAIGGLAHQLTKRNMTPGKRLSHIIRMECMIDNYFDMDPNMPMSTILTLDSDRLRLAREAKADPNNPAWDEQCSMHEQIVQDKIQHADMTKFAPYEAIANQTITHVAEQFVTHLFAHE